MALNSRKVFLAVALASTYLLAAGGVEKPLVHEGVISAPIASVWDALTTKAGLESWMVAHAEIELAIGGRMLTHYDPKGIIGDAGTIENTIICFDPKRMFSFRVSKPPAGFPFPNDILKMWTVIYLEPEKPNNTRIRIVGLGFTGDENSQKMRQFFDKGNAFTLKSLQGRFAAKAPRN